MNSYQKLRNYVLDVSYQVREMLVKYVAFVSFICKIEQQVCIKQYVSFLHRNAYFWTGNKLHLLCLVYPIFYVFLFNIIILDR
jgi:hypothetical protein